MWRMLSVGEPMKVPSGEINSTEHASYSAPSTAAVRSDTNAQAYAIEDQRRMSDARNYFAWQARRVKREIGHRVVEVGCGIGNFTGRLLDREAVCAVDAEANCVECLLARYEGRRNLSAVACDVQSEEFSRLSAFGADSCVCLNVLEHIADDRCALRRMASILQPGGAIVLLVPAFWALYGAIDRNLGHYRRYTRASVANLATASGLRVKKVQYMNAAGFFGWWVNTRLVRRKAQSPAQIRIFDRCVVPWESWIEGYIAPPFGQSIFAVLQKQ